MALKDLKSNLATGAGTPFVTTPMIERGHSQPAAFTPDTIQGGTCVIGRPLIFPKRGTDTTPFVTDSTSGKSIAYTKNVGPLNTTTFQLKSHGKALFNPNPPKYSDAGMTTPSNIDKSRRSGFSWQYNPSLYSPNQYYQQSGFDTGAKGSDTLTYLKTLGLNLKTKYEGSPLFYSNSGFKEKNFFATTKLSAATLQWIGGTGKDWARTTGAGGSYNYKENKYYGQALKYGLDVSGGGDSNKPYIVRRIGQTWYGGNSGNPPSTCHVGSSFIRGGATTVLNRTTADIKRISKYLASPCGLLWMVLQQGLQLTNPKTENTLLQGTRIFNPLSIVANIGGAAAGVHIQRHGLPFVSQTYEEIVRSKIDKGLWDRGKLVSGVVVGPAISLVKQGKEFKHFDINSKKPEEWEKPEPKGKFGKKIKSLASKLVGKLTSMFGDGTNKTLSSPLGGPHSVYGIGGTWIKRSTVFSDALTAAPKGGIYKNEPGPPFMEGLSMHNYFGGTSLQLGNAAQIGTLSSKDAAQPGQSTKPYGKALQVGVSTTDAAGDKTVNLITADDCKLYNALTYQEIQNQTPRVNGGDPKTVQSALKKPVERFPLSALGKSGDKKIQPLESNQRSGGRIYGTYISGSTESDPIMKNTGTSTSGSLGNDLIKLKIGGTQFMCYIQSLSDKWSPSWSDVEYVGRPDKAHIYKGFGRSISFNFMVAAMTKAELSVVWGKCQKLAQLCAPKVNSTGIMSGPKTTLQIGSYFNPKQLPGHIDSLTFEIDDGYIWDIEREAPMYVKVDITFIPTFYTTPTSATSYFGNMITT